MSLQSGKAKPLPPYMLCLRDPADETNDLCRKATAIKHLQATFAKLCQDLGQATGRNSRVSLLGPLVGTSYMRDKKRRETLRAYGSAMSTQARASLAETARAVRSREVPQEDDEKEVAEKQEQARLAREARDLEWRRLSEERNARLQEQAQRTAVLEHGDAMADILGMPSVKHDAASSNQQ